MEGVAFRPARQDEARLMARLYSISSDGVADYVWSQMAGPGEAILDVGARRYSRDDTPFSYRNCTLVDCRGEVLGMLVAFPAPPHTGPASEPEDPILVPYARLELPGSYYVCGMALFPEYRGQGLGSALLRLADQRAAQLRLARLSLLVFEQNSRALNLYLKHGYREIGREAVVPHPLIHYTGNILLMSKDVVHAP